MKQIFFSKLIFHSIILDKNFAIRHHLTERPNFKSLYSFATSTDVHSRCFSIRTKAEIISECVASWNKRIHSMSSLLVDDELW